MLDDFGSTFLALGPVVVLGGGVVVTVVLASISDGRKRWLMLFCGPAVTLVTAAGSTYLVLEFIDPVEGSGFLLGGTAIIVFAALLAVYYPVLAVIWAVHRHRSRAA